MELLLTQPGEACRCSPTPAARRWNDPALPGRPKVGDQIPAGKPRSVAACPGKAMPGKA